MDGKVSGWLDAEMARSDELAVSPEAMRFSRSMKGTLTQDVSSASSTKTQTGRLRVEHRHGWQGAEMVIDKASNGTCENALRN